MIFTIKKTKDKEYKNPKEEKYHPNNRKFNFQPIKTKYHIMHRRHLPNIPPTKTQSRQQHLTNHNHPFLSPLLLLIITEIPVLRSGISSAGQESRQFRRDQRGRNHRPGNHFLKTSFLPFRVILSGNTLSGIRPDNISSLLKNSVFLTLSIISSVS